jgi:hypothetical protein
MRQHTSGCVRMRQDALGCVRMRQDASADLRQHASAYMSVDTASPALEAKAYESAAPVHQSKAMKAHTGCLY